MAVTGLAVATTFAIQLGILLAACLLFSQLRLVPWLSRFFAPKRFDRSLKVRPKRLPLGFFSWMFSVWSADEDEIVAVGGMDAAVLCRCMSFGAECFLWISLWTLVVILPINLSGDQVQGQLDQNPSNNSSPPAPLPPLPPSPPLPPGYPPSPACGEYSVSIQTVSPAVSPFDKCSLTNIAPGSSLMWAHAISVYVITFIVLKIMLRYNSEVTLLRILFLANSPRGGPSHTVLVTDIPGLRYGTLRNMIWRVTGKRLLGTIETGLNKVEGGLDKAGTKFRSLASGPQLDEEGALEGSSSSMGLRKHVGLDRKEADVWYQAEKGLRAINKNQDQEANLKRFLKDEFEYCYGEKHVAAVNPAWDQSALDPLHKEYEEVKQKLEDYLDDLAYKHRRRMVVKERLQVRDGHCGRKVDAIRHWTSKLKEITLHINEAKVAALMTPIPLSFVTFNTRAAQARAATSLHHHNELTWRIQAAPAPNDVVWGNLRLRFWQQSGRTVLLWVVYILLLLFYIVPVTIVQGVVNLQNLAKFPGVSTFVNLPFISQVLQGILPTVVLMIFLAVLPSIIRLMCYLSGFISWSSIDFGVASRYFYFQVVAVFLYNMVAGSFINQYEAILRNPAGFINVIGAAVPQTASFFITYILTSGIAQLGIQFLRIVPLILFLLRHKFASTGRAKARLWADQYRLVGPILPAYIMPFFLGLIYCLINPIMSPVVLIFFTFAILFERFYALYVYKSEYESGGRVWAMTFHQFLLGLYFTQVFMMVLLGIKKFEATPIIIPTLLATFVFHIYVTSLYARPWTMLSVHDAAMLDYQDQQRGAVALNDQEIREIHTSYLSPVFKMDPAELEKLLLEADTTSRRLDGEEEVAGDLEGGGGGGAEPLGNDKDQYDDANEALEGGSGASSSVHEGDERGGGGGSLKAPLRAAAAAALPQGGPRAVAEGTEPVQAAAIVTPPPAPPGIQQVTTTMTAAERNAP